MKKIYATVIKNRKQFGRTCVISKDLLNEILEDSKHYKIRNKEQLQDVIVYDLLHIHDDGSKSIIFISEEI
jgi:hypothetical protein